MLRFAGMLLLLGWLACVGCSAGSRAEELAGRSLDDVTAEADKMTETGLEHRAQLYRDAIHREQDQLVKLRETLGRLSNDEKQGSKGKTLSDRMIEVGRIQSRLIESYQIYIDRLHSKGISTEPYKL